MDNTNLGQFVTVLPKRAGGRNGKKNMRNSEQQSVVHQASNNYISLEEIATRIQVDYFSRYAKNDITSLIPSTHPINLINLECFLQAYQQDVPKLALIKHKVISPVQHA